MSLIQVENLTKSYEDVEVLHDIHFSVEPGTIYGLLGKNGAGKTTLLQILSGLLEFDRGSVVINSFNLALNSREAKKELGYVPDQPFLYQYLTGKEYLEFIADLWDIRNVKPKIQELLSFFKLEEKSNALVSTYSFGMKQKLSIAGSLLPNPKVMILDEPLTGFDPPSAKMMKDFFRNYANAGNSIIFSTHIVDIAKNFCDQVGVLTDGKIVKEIINPINVMNFEQDIIDIIGEEII